MKRKKILQLNLIILLMLIFFPLNSFASLPSAPTSFYLDELGMLDKETMENITQTNRELEQKTGSQIMVATIKNPNGLPASDLAPKIFNQWTIGDQTKKNGVLMLITEDDLTDKKEIFIATGYGIEGRLNDGKVGRIIDNFMIDDLKSGNYSKAINEGFKAIVAEVADEYGVELNGNYDYYLDVNSQSYSGGFSLASLFIMLVFFIILSNMFTRMSLYGGGSRRYYRRYPRYGRRYYNDPFGGYYRGGSNPFGGSSSFGNSSFGGSSGNSYSGGFKGGGGTTGGGGAGRSF